MSNPVRDSCRTPRSWCAALVLPLVLLAACDKKADVVPTPATGSAMTAAPATTPATPAASDPSLPDASTAASMPASPASDPMAAMPAASSASTP